MEAATLYIFTSQLALAHVSIVPTAVISSVSGVFFPAILWQTAEGSTYMYIFIGKTPNTLQMIAWAQLNYLQVNNSPLDQGQTAQQTFVTLAVKPT